MHHHKGECRWLQRKDTPQDEIGEEVDGLSRLNKDGSLNVVWTLDNVANTLEFLNHVDGGCVEATEISEGAKYGRIAVVMAAISAVRKCEETVEVVHG